MAKWQSAGNNSTLDHPWGFISYNPSAGQSIFDDLIRALGQPNPRGAPETAICVRTPSKTFGFAYYILCGDHRAQLEQCSTLAECMEYFRANIAQIHPSSDTEHTAPEATQ